MAPRKKQPQLLTTLEKRLERLTEGLEVAEVTDKSIDIVKEIKELSSIIKALRENADEGNSSDAICVVWGTNTKQ